MDNLTPEMLLNAYAQGFFPMADSRDSKELHWYFPEQRGIIPLDTFHVPASLAKFMKTSPFTVTMDKAFREVITACATREEDTWINDRIIDLYCQLHEMGFAHSVEVWKNAPSVDGASRLPAAPGGAPLQSQEALQGASILVGGLYGVSLGKAFFGESMFSRETNASKVALVHLVEYLRTHGYTLLDTQYVNDHLKQFGVIEISRADYLGKLNKALEKSK